MTRRSGMSLTEVLVALFVMALGTISILTLFPIGALNVGQALKDDRTAQAALQADALMRTRWQIDVIENSSDPFVNAFFDPTSANNTANPVPSPKQPFLLPLSPGMGPSYPVVIDPMGIVARSGPDQFWVANQSTTNSNTNLARRNLQFAAAQAVPTVFATRLCSLLDGFGYSPNGLADTHAGTSPIDREQRYNWLWVLQLPDTANRTSANMTVVVFDKRPPLFAPSTAETIFVPTTQGFGCGPGQTVVSFASAIPVQKGSWLLDATVTHMDSTGTIYVPPTAPPTPPGVAAVRNANFYRVVSVTPNPASGTTDVELQTPLASPDTKTPGTPDATPGQRRFIVLSGVSEVFQRPLLP